MIISYIKHNQFHYINLHSEVSYFQSFKLDDNNLGIYVNVLDNITLVKVIECINQLIILEDELIILDFNNLTSLETNCHSEFLKIKTDKIIFKNINKDCTLNLIKSDYIFNFNNDKLLFDNVTDTYNIFSFSKKTDEIHNIELIKNYDEVFQLELEKNIEEHCLKDVKKKNELSKKTLHHSSSVYLPFYFDTKELLTKNKKLFILSIYYLAKQMTTKSDSIDWFISIKNNEQNDKKQKNNKSITLFCQNLNSSFIATLLSRFILTDLMIIDHIGPINRIYNEIEKKIKHGDEYITIGDVVCMGTEVKISKNIIEFSGGTYLGNVSLIRIMTVREEDRYKDAFSLFEINKKRIEDSNDNSKFKNFRISTALD